MIHYFVRKLNNNQEDSSRFRTKIGITAAVLGLISNGLLFGGKLFIGLLSGSVSIMADAINNLSDTASSLLTLVGFHIAGKPADKEHPYGHERFEYISGLIVSILVIYVGLQFLQTSFEKIIHPTSLSLNVVVFLVLLLSIGIKIWQSRMYLGFGKEINSGTLKVTAQDSLNDVITTITVLVSAVVEYFFSWRIDGYVGFVIALYILYSGITMIRDFIDELMGSRPTEAEIKTMEERLDSYQSILGYHDLLIHSYGPNKHFASVHIEVNEAWHLNYAHQVIDTIERDFREKLEVELVCHLDPVPVNDRNFMAIYHEVQLVISQLKLDLRLHDFRLEKGLPAILNFDLVIPPNCPLEDQEIYQKITAAIQEKIGEYKVNIQFDHNYLL